MLATGELAPDFELPDQDGRKRRLADLQGGKPLILYFYPADFTPGCTREACDLRDLPALHCPCFLHILAQIQKGFPEPGRVLLVTGIDHAGGKRCFYRAACTG